MKTIIVKLNGDEKVDLTNFVNKLEKYIDKQVNEAVICTRYLGADNYNTIYGELKDAVSINDFDFFIIGVLSSVTDVTGLQALNKAHTLVCDTLDLSSAKNFVIMI